MSDKTGGPAFPVCPPVLPNGEKPNGYPFAEEGMMLRDYFAAKALPAWVQAHIERSVDDLDAAQIAEECYRYADAMLAERAK